MSLSRILVVLRRDLGRGPRSAFFLYALFMPVLITLVTKVILLALFDPEPRLGMVDLGDSEISAAAFEGIDLQRFDTREELVTRVEGHDLDAGLVLPVGFDAAVRAGERPPLDLSLSGESRVTDRIVLAVAVFDAVREVEGKPAPVEVTTAVGSEGALPLEDLIVLGILLWPLLVCSTLVPGMLIAQEREQRTLQALLVTPTTLAEVLFAKSALGFGMAMFMCLVTLGLADAFGAHPVALVVGLAVSILMCSEFGLLYGTIARDGKTVYNLAQTMNMVILAPLIWYFFPAWPQWPAKLFPTWWFIDPLYRITMQGATLGDVWFELAVALVFAALLAIPVVWLARRMRAQLVAG